MEMGPKEEARGWPGLGQGVGPLLESLRPACREGGGGQARLSPGLCLRVPLLCNLSAHVCVDGVSVGAGGRGPGVWSAGPASSRLYCGEASRIYFRFQFSNFDNLAWRPASPALSSAARSGACVGAWQAVGKAVEHIMAVAAAGREGSLEPAAGAGVWQGAQMWGPPCAAGPH